MADVTRPVDAGLVAQITEAVMQELKGRAPELTVPVGLSNRHVHLDQVTLERLFGPGHRLTQIKPLSQPGQFACEEQVTLVGPKGTLEKVRVLGPVRKATQVELLVADCIKVGIKPVVIDSGSLDNAQEIELVGPRGRRTVKAAMVAGRHIHFSPSEAEQYGVTNGERVSVSSQGPRAVTFHNVLVRVDPTFALDCHLDLEEGNAAGLKNGDRLKLLL